MYSEIAANKRKTVLLILGFFVLIGALAWLFGTVFGDPSLTYLILFGAGIYVLISYFSASNIALGLNGAHEIQKADNPRLWRIVENLAMTNGMPMPKVYIMEDSGLNAFATGRNPNHASVAITNGLLNELEDSELQGVMAHELGHIKNYDIRVSMIAFALVGVVGLLCDFFLRASLFGDDDDDAAKLHLIIAVIAFILAPIVAALIQLSISRKREYLADATGVLTTRYPEGLARALEKIGQGGPTLKRQNTSTAHLFIANPLKGKSFTALFSTHPPIADRVAKLRAMESQL